MRDCADCKEYFYHDGVKQLGPDGKPIRRGPGQEPSCRLCPKWDEEAKNVWPGFTQRNELLFNVFLMCWFFNKLPDEGGVMDQDPQTISIMLMLAEMFSRSKDNRDKNFQVQLANRAMTVR
jgi:hypothetical protein